MEIVRDRANRGRCLCPNSPPLPKRSAVVREGAEQPAGDTPHFENEPSWRPGYHAAVLTVWDILGKEEFAARYADAYLRGTGGILAVCDLTRPDTLDSLGKWLDLVHKVVGNVPGILLANKKDLREHIQLDEDDLLA